MEPDCVNLRERFGDRYRIGFDPSYDPAHVPRSKLDPWMMTVPGRFGIVYPVGGDKLAVEVDGHPQIAAVLAKMSGVVLTQDGDGEKTFTFPVELFGCIAEIVRLRRRPQLTDVQRAELAERARINLLGQQATDYSETGGSEP